MPRTIPVTLQINVAPTDYPYAVNTLPHQLRQWAGQMQEIIFSFDLHRTAHGGRFGEGWEERREPMRQLLEQLCRVYPAARVVEVDYRPETVRDVARTFTTGSIMPAKDTKGAPFYPYFHGLKVASNDLVFHLDSDLMFGGGSQSWVTEAGALLADNPDLLACSPLPGPPAPDGRLRGQPSSALRDLPSCFRFSTLSTRLFLLDRARLRERVLPLRLLPPIRLVSRIKARMHGNPPYRAAELMISDAMGERGLYRADFLGAAPGMWSLHPPFRSERFFQQLPRLIERIETGDVPDAQLGDYEMNDSMFDWSDARRRAQLRRVWA